MVPAAARSQILIVSGEAGQLAPWLDLLGSAGFGVIHARSCSDAMDMLRDVHLEIDVLIAPVMHDLSGAELAVRAKEVHRRLRVILVADMASQAGTSGDVAILLNPVDDSEVLSTLRRLLLPTTA